MAASPPMKEAVAIVLDVSRPASAESFSLAKSVCSNLIQQKIIFSPRDEIGVIFAGSNTTLNRMHVSAPGRYNNIEVVSGLASPSLDVFKPLDAAVPQDGPMDMLEALLVAADHIFEKTGTRRYQRRIFLVSDVRQTVKRKEELDALITFLKQHSMQLVVIGIDFDDTAAQGQNEDWNCLTPKQQNERVLQFICGDLGEGSLVVPVSDAFEALSALRKRSIGQRATTRCVLSVGDVRIAIHMYTKSLQAIVPSLKKTYRKEGVVMERKHFSLSAPDKELDPATRVKAYRYGKSVIPFSEVDEAMLKFEGERSMATLGFVALSQVPMHLLLGGVKIVAAAPGDTAGATAISALVNGMDQLQRAMLVRFVRCTNANPCLGVCLPSPKPERDVMYFAPLPFAEDVRHYRFPAYDDIVCLPEEIKAVDQLVNALTMDKDTLKPNQTFNPALQYYYQCVKDRFIGNLDPGAPTRALPPVNTTLTKHSCHFEGPDNVLAAMLRGAQGVSKTCAEMFPYRSAEDKEGGKGGKTFWFAKGAMMVKEEAPLLCSPGGGGGVSLTGPSSLTTSQTDTNSTPLSALKDAAALHSSVDTKVTTVDPIGTFLTLIKKPGADNVDSAIFQMSEVILTLLKNSMGTQYYAKCIQCIDVLRSVCVQEEEAATFNKFLINLMLTVKGVAHEEFWTIHCVARGLRPITRLEVKDSDVADAAAAEEFVRADRSAVAPVAEAEDNDDLFGELE